MRTVCLFVVFSMSVVDQLRSHFAIVVVGGRATGGEDVFRVPHVSRPRLYASKASGRTFAGVSNLETFVRNVSC